MTGARLNGPVIHVLGVPEVLAFPGVGRLHPKEKSNHVDRMHAPSPGHARVFVTSQTSSIEGDLCALLET